MKQGKGATKGAGLHHGAKKRTMKSRDGHTWDPCGGDAVGEKQCHGYSGADGKQLNVTPKNSGRGSHY